MRNKYAVNCASYPSPPSSLHASFIILIENNLKICIILAFFFLFLFFFWLHRIACGILIPWPGFEPMPCALELQSPNHWTVREFPASHFLNNLIKLLKEIQQRKAIKIELGVKDLIFKFCFSDILAMQTLGLTIPTCIGGGSQKNHHFASGQVLLLAIGLSPFGRQIVP